MISRRLLLAGMSALAVASSDATAGLRFHGQAAGNPPSAVGPGGLWNGAALSGGTPPTDNSPSGPSPIVKFYQPDGIRLWQDQTIGVYADCWGSGGTTPGAAPIKGVKWVEFWVEGNVIRVTTPSVLVDVDATGATRKRLGYWITLKASLFTAVSTTGTARIFATATPNDPTMFTRTIGQDAVNPYDKAWRQTYYPRTTESDFIRASGCKVGALVDGADYTTLDAAITAARAVGTLEAPKFVFVTSGSYTLVDIAGDTGTASAKGFAVITQAPGITATLVKASIDLNDTTFLAHRWRPGWLNIEFRGALTFDVQNYPSGFINNAPCFFNGVTFTNTNTNWQFYLNGSALGGANVYGDDQTPHQGWTSDGIGQFGGTLPSGNLAVYGTKYNNLIGSPCDGMNCVIGTYIANCDSTIYLGATPTTSTGNPAIQITGPANSTVNIFGGGASNFATVQLKVSGSVVKSWACGTIPSDNSAVPPKPLYPSDLAALINAFGSGWSATAYPTGFGPLQAARFLVDAVNVVVTSQQTFKTFQDIHTEWWHGRTDGGAGVRENVLLVNNIGRNSTWNSAPLFFETAMKDVMIRNNALQCNLTAGGVGGPGNFGYVHTVITDNWIDGGFLIGPFGPDTTMTGDAYCISGQNLVDYYDSSTVPKWPSFFRSVQNYSAGPAGFTDPSGPYDTGNVKLGVNAGATYLACITNRATGDFRPAGSMLGTLYPKMSDYDGLLVARSANDTGGPWSINVTAGQVPVYPF